MYVKINPTGFSLKCPELFDFKPKTVNVLFI